MPAITTSDGATMFYKDSGDGPPAVFSHGWPHDDDAWDIRVAVERGVNVAVPAYDWSCRQDVIPRFTLEEITAASPPAADRRHER